MRGTKALADALSKLTGTSDKVGGYAQAALAAPVVREYMRTSPIPESTKYAESALDAAFDRQVDELKPGARVGYNLSSNVPKSETLLGRLDEVVQQANKFGSSSRVGKRPGVAINPNASRELFAHELGHLASQQTDVGRYVAELRYNPKLQQALMGAMMTVPALAAVLEEGDDDMDSSLALATIAAAPTLADEALATRQGLAIMDKAGLRADLGQRGRLAGGLLSYLAAPIIAGTAGNVVGNMLD